MAEFSSKGKVEKLKALFVIYNNVWVDKVGTPGMRILVK